MTAPGTDRPPVPAPPAPALPGTEETSDERWDRICPPIQVERIENA